MAAAQSGQDQREPLARKLLPENDPDQCAAPAHRDNVAKANGKICRAVLYIVEITTVAAPPKDEFQTTRVSQEIIIEKDESNRRQN